MSSSWQHLRIAITFLIPIVLIPVFLCSPPRPSYEWRPRQLECEHYGSIGTRCVLKVPGTTVEYNPGCFEEAEPLTNTTRVYCALRCEESDETTMEKKIPQYHRDCNIFYTYNFERRRDDWYLWRSGNCMNATIQFYTLCGTPTNPKFFYINNAHLFEYEDAE